MTITSLKLNPWVVAKIEKLEQQLAEFKHGQDTYQQLFNDEKAENTKLRQQVTLLRGLLLRYRTETPPAHSPHMICHEVDEALEATEPKEN